MNTGTPDNSPRILISYFAILAAVIFWGGSFAVMRETVRDIGATTVMSLRMLVALVVLLPFSGGFVKSYMRSRQPGDGKILILTVLLQPCLYFLFESNALRFTSASQAGVISSIAPILTAVGAWFFLKEPLDLKTFLGMGVAVAGITVMTLSGEQGSDAPKPMLGNILEIAAMICVAGNLVAVRGLSRNYSTWLITGMQTLAGFLFFFPGFIPIFNGTIQVRDLPFGPLLYLGLACTLGAFGLYNWGMRRIPAARASSFINLIPVIAAAGGWFLLGERLNIIQIAAAAAVLAGVIFSQWKSLINHESL